MAVTSTMLTLQSTKEIDWTTSSLNKTLLPQNDEETCETGVAEIMESTFLVLVCTLGTFGNMLVITALCTTPALRTRSNLFIFFLASVDLVTTSILAPFFILTLLNGRWPYDEVYCKVLGYAALICLAMSVLSLGLIAVTRYVAVTRPKHMFRKQCNYYVISVAFCVLAIMISLIIILPEVVNFGKVGYNKDLGHCSMVCDADSDKNDWWFCATLFLAGVLSTMTITPAYYALTLWVVRKSRMTVATIGRNNNSHRETSTKDSINVPAGAPSPTINLNRTPTLSREEIRLTKKLMLLFLIFFICWCPYSIVVLADKHGIIPQPVHRFANLFVWVNSCLNPYLYAWMMRSFRHAYRKITRFEKWRKYLPCKKVREGSNSGTSIIMSQGTL